MMCNLQCKRRKCTNIQHNKSYSPIIIILLFIKLVKLNLKLHSALALINWWFVTFMWYRWFNELNLPCIHTRWTFKTKLFDYTIPMRSCAVMQFWYSLFEIPRNDRWTFFFCIKLNHLQLNMELELLTPVWI